MDSTDTTSIPAIAAERPESGRKPSVEGSFSPLQRTVIELARHDGANTLRDSGIIVRTARRLFGSARAPHLANACLEALRQLVVRLRTARHGAAEPQITSALESGLTHEQIDLLVQRFEGKA